MKINKCAIPEGLISGTFWFPVRTSVDEGQEFVSLSEWGASPSYAGKRAYQTNQDCSPGYGAANPVVRIAKIKVILVEEVE